MNFVDSFKITSETIQSLPPHKYYQYGNRTCVHIYYPGNIKNMNIERKIYDKFQLFWPSRYYITFFSFGISIYTKNATQII